MEQLKTPVVIMRGGTSKGVYIKEEHLPKNQVERDNLILKIFGSPDIRQIDGLGGADPLTSKLAIIGKSEVEGADVDYTFGQVSYTAATIDYSGNCGNISAGVGPFAVDEGLVDIQEPITTVRIFNTNTGKMLIEKVGIIDGKAKVTGDYEIAGVPGSGSEVVIDFSAAQGAATGYLLPTGNIIDTLEIEGVGSIEVSLVDAANPVVFVRAKDLKMSGIETPSEIDENKSLLKTLEEIRAKGAVKMGLCQKWENAVKDIPAFPMIAVISEAHDYTSFTNGKIISEKDIDIVSRLLYMQVVHKTYAGTATVCTGVASRIKGSIVHQAMVAKNRGKDIAVKIGHPAGIIELNVSAELIDNKWNLTRAEINRTARRIMDGHVYTVK